MLKLKHLSALIASLTLAACGTFGKPSAPPMQPSKVPPLDSKLAEPCPTLTAPEVLDFDVWMEWVQDVVLREYGNCAIRHRATVAAWPK